MSLGQLGPPALAAPASRATLELDQSIGPYDPQSLQGVVAADGSAWFALKIDPVNPDGGRAQEGRPRVPRHVPRRHRHGKATRKARLLATGARHRFGVIGDRFWLLERNNGFERGGKSLTVYQRRAERRARPRPRALWIASARFARIERAAGDLGEAREQERRQRACR